MGTHQALNIFSPMEVFNKAINYGTPLHSLTHSPKGLRDNMNNKPMIGLQKRISDFHSGKEIY